MKFLLSTIALLAAATGIVSANAGDIYYSKMTCVNSIAAASCVKLFHDLGPYDIEYEKGSNTATIHKVNEEFCALFNAGYVDVCKPLLCSYKCQAY